LDVRQMACRPPLWQMTLADNMADNHSDHWSATPTTGRPLHPIYPTTGMRTAGQPPASQPSCVFLLLEIFDQFLSLVQELSWVSTIPLK
jgi:hypothetical protein